MTRFARAICLLLATSAHAAPGDATTTGHPYVETGVEVGGALGVEGPSYSTVRAVSEIGYMWERSRPGRDRGWGFGATFYAGLGNEDMRLGITPRVRYRVLPNWSIDVSAGVIFATLESGPYVSDTGFVGGIHSNHGKWVTLRVDVNVVEVGEWTTYQVDQPVSHGGGYETAVYGGVAMRNSAGWIATAVGVAGFITLMLIVVASGGAS